MNITLQLMKVEEKSLLIQLMELYNYEFSAYSDDDINEYGYYGYAHIDDGKIAGLALICPHCDYRKEENAKCIGEFFVLLKYRGRGVGREAAVRLFDMHPGLWEVCYWKNNLPAGHFWKKVIEKYTDGHYEICGAEEDKEMGFIFQN